MRIISLPLLALPLLVTLGACGGDKAPDGNALASLDTRLANGAAAGDAQAPRTAGVVTERRDTAADGASTLGGLAVKQGHEGAVQRLAAANGRRVGGCAGRELRYGVRWADALPDGIALYPGARLTEAAGADTARCALRVVSFTTADSPQAVAAHYKQSARAAGFSAERQPCRTEIRLGGVRSRDDAAYMLFARRAGGRTEVDIIASAGPTA